MAAWKVMLAPAGASVVVFGSGTPSMNRASACSAASRSQAASNFFTRFVPAYVVNPQAVRLTLRPLGPFEIHVRCVTLPAILDPFPGVDRRPRWADASSARSSARSIRWDQGRDQARLSSLQTLDCNGGDPRAWI